MKTQETIPLKTIKAGIKYCLEELEEYITNSIEWKFGESTFIWEELPQWDGKKIPNDAELKQLIQESLMESISLTTCLKTTKKALKEWQQTRKDETGWDQKLESKNHLLKLLDNKLTKEERKTLNKHLKNLDLK